LERSRGARDVAGARGGSATGRAARLHLGERRGLSREDLAAGQLNCGWLTLIESFFDTWNASPAAHVGHELIDAGMLIMPAVATVSRWTAANSSGGHEWDLSEV
jgi:hypothetical protein